VMDANNTQAAEYKNATSSQPNKSGRVRRADKYGGQSSSPKKYIVEMLMLIDYTLFKR